MPTNILIADDHPLFRAAIKHTLSGMALPEDFTATECETLAEVHSQLEANDDVDLVLLDLHMPGATGFGGLVYPYL